MQQGSAVTYVLLLATSLSANKFVLSTLGFQYPMVFQGWQTLVGFVIYRLLHACGRISIVSLDMAGYISLFPFFLFFCSSILTGSMALSKIPLVSFVSVSAVIPVAVCILGHYDRRSKAGFLPTSSSSSSLSSAGNNSVTTAARYQLAASVVVLAFNAALLLLEQPGAAHEGYFWMEVHCFCSLGLVLYGRLADARYNAIDRQYYSYIFSLVVLLPASLYLEEAFEALHFKELSQALFVAGSVVCAVSGVALHFQQTRLRPDRRFGQLHHLGLLMVTVASLGYFTVDVLSAWSVLAALVASIALLFVPTYLSPEEPAPMATTAAVAEVGGSDDPGAAPLMEVESV